MAKKFREPVCWSETFKQTVTAVAVPLDHPLAEAFVAKFMTEAITDGRCARRFDNNGLRATPIRPCEVARSFTPSS